MMSICGSIRKTRSRQASVAFTEHGAVTVANILKSRRAAAMSVEVVRAFVGMRRLASSRVKIARLLPDRGASVPRRADV